MKKRIELAGPARMVACVKPEFLRATKAAAALRGQTLSVFVIEVVNREIAAAEAEARRALGLKRKNSALDAKGEFHG